MKYNYKDGSKLDQLDDVPADDDDDDNDDDGDEEDNDDDNL